MTRTKRLQTFCVLVGMLFAVVGMMHLLDSEAFAIAVDRYQLLPTEFVPWVALWLSLFQVVVGLQLLLEILLRPAMLLTALLFLIFAVAVAIAVVRHQDISCGCFGQFSPTVSPAHSLVSLGLAVVAMMLFLGPEETRKKPDGRFHGTEPEVTTMNIRQGFTLLELIVSMVVIGILIAITLPAIQSIRESARTMLCANNLRQIGLACFNYESARKTLPPGTLGFPQDAEVVIRVGDWPAWEQDSNHPYYIFKNQNTSWLVFLLPYVEQSGLSDQLPSNCTDQSRDFVSANSGFARIVDMPQVQHVMKLPVALFECPSDASQTGFTAVFGSQPAFESEAGIDGLLFGRSEASAHLPAARTNYAGCCGAYSGGVALTPTIARFGGSFGSRQGMHIASIEDGTSNTILAGECLGTIEYREVRSNNGWMFASLIRGRSQMKWGESICTENPGLEIIGDEWFSWQVGFASSHPFGVNTLFADGSVRPVYRDIAIETFYSMCGKADGT